MKTKSMKGITLIALVITIIVLLILAGVSISAITSENGILKEAINAKEKTEISEEKEQINLSYDALKMDVLIGNDEDDRVSAEELEIKMNTIYGEGTVEVNENLEEETLTIIYKKTQREYTIDNKIATSNVEENYISEVNVGDYISNYPVKYTNVATVYDSNGNEKGYIPRDEFVGWRVLSKEIDDDGNVYVKLISSGVPLSYYHGTKSNISVQALITNFLTTEITNEKIEYTFYKCGFENVLGTTLETTFSNGFTDKVQSLTIEDVLKARDCLGEESTCINDIKYKDLLAVPCKGEEASRNADIWLGSANGIAGLWRVYNDVTINDDGLVGSSGAIFGVRVVVNLKANIYFRPASQRINDTQTWEISL